MTKTFCDFCGSETEELWGGERRFLETASFAPAGGLAQTLNVQKDTMRVMVTVSLGRANVADPCAPPPPLDPQNICSFCFHRIVSDAIEPKQKGPQRNP